MKKLINEQARTITFTFDGGLEPLVFDVATASQANRDYAVLNGFNHALGDAAALSKSADNGFKITEVMRRDAVARKMAHFASGTEDWNERKAAGPRAAPLNAAILRIAEKRGCTYEEAMAWVANLDIEAMARGE